MGVEQSVCGVGTRTEKSTMGSSRMFNQSTTGLYYHRQLGDGPEFARTHHSLMVPPAGLDTQKEAM